MPCDSQIRQASPTTHGVFVRIFWHTKKGLILHYKMAHSTFFDSYIGSYRCVLSDRHILNNLTLFNEAKGCCGVIRAERDIPCDIPTGITPVL